MSMGFNRGLRLIVRTVTGGVIDGIAISALVGVAIAATVVLWIVGEGQAS